MKYEVTITLKDEDGGITKVTMPVDRERLLADPLVASVVRVHEQFHPPPELDREQAGQAI